MYAFSCSNGYPGSTKKLYITLPLLRLLPRTHLITTHATATRVDSAEKSGRTVEYEAGKERADPTSFAPLPVLAWTPLYAPSTTASIPRRTFTELVSSSRHLDFTDPQGCAPVG